MQRMHKRENRCGGGLRERMGRTRQSSMKQRVSARRSFFGTAPAFSLAMTEIMKNLLALQRLQFDVRSQTPAAQAEADERRQRVPAPIRDRFDRLLRRGKNGVAIARHGVCSECHLRITSGTLASLAYTTEIHVCDNCGRYLCLPDDEPLGLLHPAQPIKVAAQSAASRS